MKIDFSFTDEFGQESRVIKTMDNDAATFDRTDFEFLVSEFKMFLLAAGFLPASVGKIQIVENEFEDRPLESPTTGESDEYKFKLLVKEVIIPIRENFGAYDSDYMNAIALEILARVYKVCNYNMLPKVDANKLPITFE